MYKGAKTKEKSQILTEDNLGKGGGLKARSSWERPWKRGAASCPGSGHDCESARSDRYIQHGPVTVSDSTPGTDRVPREHLRPLLDRARRSGRSRPRRRRRRQPPVPRPLPHRRRPPPLPRRPGLECPLPAQSALRRVSPGGARARPPPH